MYYPPLGGTIHILDNHAPTSAGYLPGGLSFTSLVRGRSSLHPGFKPVFLPKPPNYGPVGQPVDCSRPQKTKCPSSLNHSTQTKLYIMTVTPKQANKKKGLAFERKKCLADKQDISKRIQKERGKGERLRDR